MKLIVGLGNPGPQYETTRHNVGFLALDRLIEKWKATGPTLKNQAEVFESKWDGEKVFLIKPQNFMNLSGRAVAPFVNFFKIPPQDMIVIHDELDLPPLTFKIKTGGGIAGHNGLRSIEESLGKDLSDYHRIRVGIGKPERGQTADYVLSPFSNQELHDLDPLLDQISESVELILKGKATEAMNRFHKKGEPK